MTDIAGAGVLALAEKDTWQTEQPLLLIENQALFDRLDLLLKFDSLPRTASQIGFHPEDSIQSVFKTQ
jgi:hypothetical protein